MMAKIILLCGPSGSGKSSIQARLSSLSNTHEIVSTTTREIRDGEKDGVDYYFKSKSEFNKLIENNAFVEHAEIFNNFYGVTKEELDRVSTEQGHIIHVVDPQGVRNFKAFDQSIKCIFILPPSNSELEKRLINRCDSLENIKERISHINEEIKYQTLGDYVVVNDDLDRAVEEVKNILEEIQCVNL